MLSTTLNNLVQDLKPRQRDVLAGRFGLENGEKKTLAALGEKFGITRERVRQIEAEALETIQERLEKEKKLIEKISSLINSHLENLGGARRDNLLLTELKVILDDKNLHHWHLRFFSEVSSQPFYYPANQEFHNFWYLDKKIIRLASRFVVKLENLISNKKEELIVHKKFDVYFAKVIKDFNLKELIALNYLSLSKKFNINPFGDLGLSHWEEITPKTIRSKSYLILKKHGRPMHFREIADKINEIGLGTRPAHPQTVHNELIKDPRFVLVGRGTYGLSEHGYFPGTAREVIGQILKAKGPLSLEEIVDAVLKQRLLKENTILLNLQNKKYFKRLEDGRYYIRR